MGKADAGTRGAGSGAILTIEGVRMTVLIIIGLAIAFGGGWYCKGRFGATAAAVKDAVSS